MFTALGYAGAKLVVYQEDCRDLVHLEDILSGVFSYPLASKGGTTVVIVLPVHKLQFVIHKCAALSMLPQVFNL